MKAVATQYPVPPADRAADELVRRAQDHGITCLWCGGPVVYAGTVRYGRGVVFTCASRCGCVVTVEAGR